MTLYLRGSAYYYDFTLDGHRHVKRVGPDKAVAKEAERVAKQRAYANRYKDEWEVRPAKERRTRLGDFLKKILVERFPDKRETHRVVWSLFRQISKRLGRHYLGQITPKILLEYRDLRLTEVSVNQVHKEFYWLRRAFRSAQKEDLVRKSPVDDIVLPRREPPPDRVLEEEEEARLLEAFTPFKENGQVPTAWVHNARLVARDMIALDLITALRRQEICELRKGHVDFRRRQIVYRQPKTYGVKTIPLVDDAVAILRRYIKPDDDPSAHVFLNRRGHPFKPGSLWCAFRAARRRAKLKGGPLRLHDLRHTVAVRLLQNGADIPTVGDILGHAPPYLTTMRYLAHVSENRKKTAMQALQKPQRTETPA